MEDYKPDSVPLTRLMLSAPITRKNILEFKIPETKTPETSELTVGNNLPITDPCQQTHIPPDTVLEKWLIDLEKSPQCSFVFPGGTYDLDAVRTAKVLHALKEEKELVRKELLYLSASTRRPNCLSVEFDIPALIGFADLIHNSVVAREIPAFQMTPSELAQLCGNRHLSDSHLSWIAERLNSMQKDVLCVSINLVDNMKNFNKKIIDRSQQTKLLLLVNGGSMEIGNTINGSNECCHFSLAIYDDNDKTIMYGDLLGREPPQDLLTMINKFTLHLFNSETSSVQLFHSSAGTSYGTHLCNTDCKQFFPLQTEGNVCDVVVIIIAVIICLSPDTWKRITEQFSPPYFYLAKPSLFNKYLRMVLMIWFSTGQINLEYIIPTKWTLVEEDSEEIELDCYDNDTSVDAPQVTIYDSALSTRKGEVCNDNGISAAINEDLNVTSRITHMCDLCQVNFANRSSLRRHVSRMHKGASVQQKGENSTVISENKALCPSTVHDVNITSNITTKCKICQETFSTLGSLRRHTKRKHKDATIPHTIRGTGSRCVDCGMGFYRVADLKNHLVEKHDFQFPTEEFRHKSFAEFELWKLDLERKNSCNFISWTGKTTNKLGETVTYYRCNRSGFYVPRHQKRKQRKCGTRKIDNNCTASLYLRKLADGTYSTECCMVHYGHKTEVQHLNLPKDVKHQIAAKLYQGVPHTTILDEIRQNIQGNILTREHSISRSDIRNVATSIGIKLERDSNEEDAVLKDERQFLSLKSRAEGQIIQLLASVRQCTISDKDSLKQVLHGVTQITNSFEATKKH